MDKIKIITDSTCDLNNQVIREYDIDVIPLIVNFGEESYIDGVDINIREFLRKMDEENIFPTTSGINPNKFYEHYKKYLEEGYKIISIHLSSKMSGTYQSACIAKEMLETDDIVVIDSMNVTAGLGLLAIKAAQLAKNGHSIQEIKKVIEDTIPHVKNAYAFASLDNLVKGGRLSKTMGAIGNLLNIKLILAVVNGEMAVIDKVRGTKKAIKTILSSLEKMDSDELSILLQIDNNDIRSVLEEELKNKGVNFIVCDVGCVVGTHSGPNACGVAFIEKF
ncbi:DegV family protein [Clostridium botulinum]|uniref:DegV protein n=1 Tax=Clostridium botulinum D str. 1873 TaxID=592027 RepID=A0A9P2G7Y0_CLOBO|nr:MULTISPECIES: DegV family protein [Clostridium]AYF53526.1 DegV family protein [Clostridium novyi]EES91632.1 DegV protein [Clostridium botulinum D str. 1873]MBO3440879.1 DegV family protein [Clostridium haemolyticum]NFV48035.1 DegV family protein [Clostridium botulinum]QPW55794.1 DegV family protein [Clostridium botulinum]